MTDTAAVPPKLPPAAIDVASSLEAASTVTLPVALIVTSFAIHASVVLLITSTSTPAPTPAVPPIPTVPERLNTDVMSVAETATPALVASPPTVAPWSM